MEVRKRRATLVGGGAGEDGDFIQLRKLREKYEAERQAIERDESSISLSQLVTSEDGSLIKRSGSQKAAHKEKERLTSELFAAIQRRDRNAIDNALFTAKKRMRIEDIRDPVTDQTILHAAMCQGMKDFADFLISSEKEDFLESHHIVKQSGLEGRRHALHIAIELGQKDVAGALLRRVFGRPRKLTFMKVETAVNIEGQRPRLFSCLHLAAYYGHTDIVRMLLDEGIDVNHMNGKKDTALLWAARWGHRETVCLLLDRGADPEVMNDKGSTALYWAIRYQFPETVKLLLEKGEANPDTTRKLGLVAPIIIASAYGNSEIVELLLQHKGININRKIRGGETAIHHAAKEGHFQVVKTLISSKALCDERDEIGDTPLLLAAKNGHVRIVKVLLKHGAELNVRNHEGFDVWYYAIEHDRNSLLKALISGFGRKGEWKKNPLCIAGSRGRCDKIRFMLELSLDPSSTDKVGNNFLHHAALNDQHNVIEEFYTTVAANCKLKNNSGNTPLHIACMKGFANTISALLKCKAKTDIPNANGESVLHVAAYSQNMTAEIARHLVDYTIKNHDWNSLNAKDYGGNNCLHVAGKFAKPDVLWEFRTVKVNERDHDGLTPLHEAVRPGQPEVLETMLDMFETNKRDASINEQSYSTSETVLHYAAEAGHAKAAKRLITLGADIAIKDINGDTVLHRLVELCACDLKNITRYLEVFDTIMDSVVVWWCMKNDCSFPEHDTDATAVAYKRDGSLYLTQDICNNAGLSVLNQAFESRVPEIVKRLLMSSGVTMFDGDPYTFDVTSLTPKTTLESDEIARSKNQILPTESSTTCENSENEHVEISALDHITENSNKAHVAEILNLPPIRVLEQYYTGLVAWTFALLILVHIIYMSLFTFIGVEMCRKLREDTESITRTDPVTVLMYVIVPLEPVVVTIITIIQVVKSLYSGKVRRRSNMCKSRFRAVLVYVRAYAFYVVCILFTSLVFTWLGMFTQRHPFQDYVLAAALCFGWLLSINFTKGIQAIHFFYRMLLSMILRDVVRFIVLYIFVLLAFGFAFHVLFQVSQDSVEAYPTPADTLFVTFNMMIGMGEIIDDNFEANMDAVGRNTTYAKVIYLFYIILSTVILLNLLIAMMNDSYSRILSENQVTWRIESVSMGMEIEASLPFIQRFSRIKLTQGRTGKNGQASDDRWYVSMTESDYDAYIQAFERSSQDSSDAVSRRIDELSTMIRETNERLVSLTETVEKIDLSSRHRRVKRKHSRHEKES